MSNSNSKGATHASGVLCIIVGEPEVIGNNRGKVVTLVDKIFGRSLLFCCCGKGMLVTVPKESKIWEVTGELECPSGAKGDTYWFPQKNLLPIGTDDLIKDEQRETIKEIQKQIVKEALKLLEQQAP